MFSWRATRPDFTSSHLTYHRHPELQGSQSWAFHPERHHTWLYVITSFLSMSPSAARYTILAISSWRAPMPDFTSSYRTYQCHIQLQGIQSWSFHPGEPQWQIVHQYNFSLDKRHVKSTATTWTEMWQLSFDVYSSRQSTPNRTSNIDHSMESWNKRKIVLLFVQYGLFRLSSGTSLNHFGLNKNNDRITFEKLDVFEFWKCSINYFCNCFSRDQNDPMWSNHFLRWGSM